MADILIADDSAAMRKILSVILEEAGHTIAAEAVNGYDAYIKFNEHHPDLVLMDINMPYMNGIESLKLILSRHPYAKIILVSSENCSSIISHVIKLGALDYIMKPFAIESLIESVDKTLQSSSTLERERLTHLYSKVESL